MIKTKDIVEIHKQLQKLGSKVSDNCLDGKEHALANILHLACGGGTFGVSLNDINDIKNNNFSIECDCKHSVTRQR
jgi:hypothetical protein